MDPTDLFALGRLIAIAQRSQRWFDMAELLARRADLETNDATRAALLLARGHVLLEGVADPARAAEAFRAALALSPNNAEALAGLRAAGG